MRIATYNVNGINGRLTNLLAWLKEAAPNVVCLQELKAPDEKFPAAAIRAAGYGAIWHGQKSWNGVAILARDEVPVEIRRGLPGDPDDTHSRYIEAAIDGMIVDASICRTAIPRRDPNSIINSAGSTGWRSMPKTCSRPAIQSCSPAITTSCRPISTSTRRKDGSMTLCSGPRCGTPIGALSRRAGLTRCGPCTLVSGSTRSGSISGTLSRATRVCALIICCSARPWRSVSFQPASTGRCEGASTRAIMPPPGSSLQNRRRLYRSERGAQGGEFDMTEADRFNLQRFVTAQVGLVARPA
jgi:hypothetical protein